MNEITTLFTAIGDFFTTSDWFSMVKWPFWTLLFTVAVGGVYCARFGKKTLFNQGIGGTLNLMSLYLGVALACMHIPFLRMLSSPLPFLSVSDGSIALVNPFPTDPVNLASPLLRLMILVFLANLTDSFRFESKTLYTWLLSQIAMFLIVLALYAVITAGLSLLLPALLGRFAIVPVTAFAVTVVLMLCGKLIFTTVFPGGNPYFTKLWAFFTDNKTGALLTTSGTTILVSIAVACILHTTGHAAIACTGTDSIAMWIIFAMLLAVLYIFSTFFCAERKKN